MSVTQAAAALAAAAVEEYPVTVAVTQAAATTGTDGREAIVGTGFVHPYDAAPSTPSPGTHPVRIFIDNAEFTEPLDNDQWAGMLLAMMAMDGQVGIGSITLPGRLSTWGAKLRVYDDEDLIFMGYLGDYSHRRNPRSLTEYETTFQVWDVNRQWLGRALDDWQRPPETDDSRFGGFLGHAMSELTLDATTWVDSSPSYFIVDKAYTSDGITDVGQDLILASGRTFFLQFDQDGNTLIVHYHLLTAGPDAEVAISDVEADVDGVLVLWLGSPEAKFSVQDVALDVAVKNGIGDEALITAGTFSSGGLSFKTVVQADGDPMALSRMAVNIAITSQDARPTYTCTVPYVTGAQLLKMPAGSLISVTSSVLQLEASVQRIARIAVTPSRGADGRPVIGRWDAQLELAFPLRVGSAPLYADQALGLAKVNPIIYKTKITPETFNTPVGGIDAFVTQLLDVDGKEVHQDRVEIFFTLIQYADDAGTDPTGDGWSLHDLSIVTDSFGRCTNLLQHDSAGSAKVIEIQRDAIPLP